MSKILIITSSLGGGGAERVAVQTANGFVELGDEVSIFVLNDSGQYKTELHKDVSIISSTHKKASKSICSLTQAIRIYKPNIVFCSQAYLGALMLISRLFSLKNNVKSIVREASTPSENTPKGFKGILDQFVSKFVYKISDVVVAPCLHVEKDILDFYHIQRNVDVIYNPVDTKHILKKSKESILSKDFVFKPTIPTIIAVGRLHEVKNYPFLINAFNNVRKIINCNLLILGEGDELVNLQAQTARLNLTKEITFLGFKANPYKFIKKSSVLALTSLHEGLPNVLIQAGVLNIPAVSVDCRGGIKELLQKEFISKNHNSKEFETILIDVLKNKKSSTLRNNLQFQSNVEFASSLKSLVLIQS
jgi:glycosyltransferase involved in cell wall biosynthesis